MKVVYETIEGTDYEWIHEEIQKQLAWMETTEITPAFWGCAQADLNALWTRLSVALINCKRPIYGFKGMVTNSAYTVYPQV